jgi:hypothetical protein
VRTGPHHIATARRKLQYWYGRPWQGAASLDGRRGSELMVGHTAGVHTEFLQALTWRNGGLAPLRAPGDETDWVVDGAYNVSYGWQHRAGGPVGTIRRLAATRNGSSRSFAGTVTTYRWGPAGWRQVERRTRARLPERTAFTWGGFRVPGLQRW